MNPLAELLKKLLADLVVFKFKTQKYHWNIEGPDFAQYHAFLGTLYEEVEGSIDDVAEIIRTLDVKAPGTLKEFLDMTSIEESTDDPDAMTMLRNVLVEHDKIIAVYYIVFKTAEEAGEMGVANFIQDRIQAHEKHRWMLRAITK